MGEGGLRLSSLIYISDCAACGCVFISLCLMQAGGRLTPRAAKYTLVRHEAQEKLGFGGSWSFSDLPLKYSRGGGWQNLSCWSFDSCCQSEGSPRSGGGGRPASSTVCCGC